MFFLCECLQPCKEAATSWLGGGMFACFVGRGGGEMRLSSKWLCCSITHWLQSMTPPSFTSFFLFFFLSEERRGEKSFPAGQISDHLI